MFEDILTRLQGFLFKYHPFPCTRPAHFYVYTYKIKDRNTKENRKHLQYYTYNIPFFTKWTIHPLKTGMIITCITCALYHYFTIHNLDKLYLQRVKPKLHITTREISLYFTINPSSHNRNMYTEGNWQNSNLSLQR